MNVVRDKLSFFILRLTLLCRRQSPNNSSEKMTEEFF